MSTVPKTHANLLKCQCRKCPSYSTACKLKAMPGNTILLLGDMDKIHAETMFCAYEKSNCIEEEHGCICAKCELYTEFNLENLYYCTVTDGK